MVPTHTVRLQSMLRSLTEVILPAIDPSRALAIDQANILAANLRILLEQNDKAYQYRFKELREYTNLLQTLIQAADGGAATIARRGEAEAVLQSASPIAALPIPPQPALTSMVLKLRAAADALLAAAYEDGTDAFRKSANQSVYAQSAHELVRERSWFRAAGFEPDPASLPTIEELLK